MKSLVASVQKMITDAGAANVRDLETLVQTAKKESSVKIDQLYIMGKMEGKMCK